MHTLRNFLEKIPFQWLLVPLLCVFVCLSVISLHQPHHWLYNLEPYPDGLFYSLSGINFLRHGFLGLEYEGVSISYAIAPLYTFSLIPLELVTSVPVAIVLTNTVWVILGLSIFAWLAYSITSRKDLGLLAAVIYLLHADIFWFINLPMAENASLTICLAALSLLLLAPTAPLWTILTLIAIGCLVLTKFSLVSLAIGLGLALIIKLAVKKQFGQIGTVMGLVCVSVIGLALTNGLSNHPLSAFWLDLTTKHIFYSPAFIIPNLLGYFESLLGFNGRVLWLANPLSSVGILLMAIWGGIYLHKKRSDWQLATLLISIFSPLVLLSIFYVRDDRYLITVIPSLLLLGIIGLQQLLTLQLSVIKKVVLLGLGLLLIVVQCYSQRVVIKDIVVSDLLGRTEAWQYQAILHFNDFFQSHPNALIITSLPPYLVTTYQSGHYRVLPLSTSQEFLQKQQFAWGTDVPYDDLLAGYQKWLQMGKDLYISNSYITQQSAVIKDFELYKTHFELELVSSGCDQACNIYRLQLRTPVKH